MVCRWAENPGSPAHGAGPEAECGANNLGQASAQHYHANTQLTHHHAEARCSITRQSLICMQIERNA